MAEPGGWQKGADDPDEAMLVQRAREGDRESFGALVRRYQRLVFRVVGRGTAMLAHVRVGDELDVAAAGGGEGDTGRKGMKKETCWKCDGSGRLRTVSKAQNERYWLLIKAFEDLTAVPVVLNTSFNENEPVVCKPEEAIDCFARTRMDALAIGNFLSVKPS